jgi:hypothetical protein
MSSFRDLIVAQLPILEAAEDSRGLQRAWQHLGSVHLYHEQMEAMAEAARRALHYARCDLRVFSFGGESAPAVVDACVTADMRGSGPHDRVCEVRSGAAL